MHFHISDSKFTTRGINDKSPSIDQYVHVAKPEGCNFEHLCVCQYIMKSFAQAGSHLFDDQIIVTVCCNRNIQLWLGPRLGPFTYGHSILLTMLLTRFHDHFHHTISSIFFRRFLLYIINLRARLSTEKNMSIFFTTSWQWKFGTHKIWCTVGHDDVTCNTKRSFVREIHWSLIDTPYNESVMKHIDVFILAQTSCWIILVCRNFSHAIPHMYSHCEYIKLIVINGPFAPQKGRNSCCHPRYKFIIVGEFLVICKTSFNKIISVGFYLSGLYDWLMAD